MDNSLKLFIRYELTGRGWTNATFEQGTTKVEMTTSYLHDSLRDLTQAALRLQKGYSNVSVVFMDEPDEHQVHISRQKDSLEIEVRWYENHVSMCSGTATRYKTVALFSKSRARFRHQVLEILSRLYRDMGVEAYKAQWAMHDFPLDSYHRLSSNNQPR